MTFKYCAILFILSVLLSQRNVSADEYRRTERASTLSEDMNQFGTNALKVVKPLFAFFQNIRSKIGNDKDSEIRKLQNELRQNTYIIEFYKRLNDSNSAQIDELQTTVEELSFNCLPTAKNESDKATNSNHTVEESSTNSLRLNIPGIESVEVLAKQTIFGEEWIVMQQRIDGKEDFYRDWDTYKAGFGSIDGDFFLGLEKIYRLTNFYSCQLYIHLERFNGTVTYALYNKFEIASEDDQYRLIHVDGCSGNTTRNELDYHKDKTFHTYDRDNKMKCAEKYHGGWWYKDSGICAFTHLNGIYFDHEVEDSTSNFWYDYTSLKKVQMLIKLNQPNS